MLYKWLSPQPDEGDCVGESHSVRMLPIVGGSSDLHQLYSPVDSRLDAQYNPQYFKLRPRRETNRQPEASHGGGRLYHLVHPGVHTQICHQPLQVAVREGRDEHHRRVSHPAVLRLLVPDRIK